MIKLTQLRTESLKQNLDEAINRKDVKNTLKELAKTASMLADTIEDDDDDSNIMDEFSYVEKYYKRAVKSLKYKERR